MSFLAPLATTIAGKLSVRTKSGATAIEYGLIAALVALATITALTTLGTDLAALFTGIAAKISGVTPP